MISDVKTNQFRDILRHLQLGMKATTIQCNITKKVPEFIWGPESEASQASDYTKWFKNFVTIPQDMVVYCASSKRDLLNTSLGDKYKFRGTTDIVIAESVYLRCHDITGGIRVAVELKKQVSEGHSRQAVLELITANCLSSYPVVIALTDLRCEWVFYWITSGGIQEVPQDLQGGVALIEAILAGTGDGSYLTRCNVAAYLSLIDGGADPGVVGCPGVVDCPERIEKVDIMKLLPPPDTGDLRDFSDQMTDREVREWTAKYAVNYVMQAPRFNPTFA